jgi:hypothetical protein
MRYSVLAAVVLTVLLSLVTACATTPMKALISGVPRYYQADMRVGGSCWFPSGCGPVAGASVCAWWDKRGFPNLIDDSERESNGLPQQAIVDLGAAHYMNRDTSCAQSWVLPGEFAEGLEDYMNDHLGPRANVVRFEVFRYRITDTGYEMPDSGHTGTYEELFEIVRNEIWSGRPMVYLFRFDGEENVDGTFKVADHFGVVVGYDQTGGSRRLVIQANQSTDPVTAVTGYQNVYIGSNRYLRLGDHTKASAAVKYHLYAIRPIPNSAAEIGLGAAPLLLDSAQVDNTTYHVNGNDGVATAFFEPKLDQTGVLVERLWHDHDDWGKTDEIILQDGVCFVAGWRTTSSTSASSDSDGDGYSDEADKPDFAPVYVRTQIDTMSASSIKLTFFVELRNLGHVREPFNGPLVVHWERVETGTAIHPIGAPASSSGTPIAVHPLYPDSSTENVTWSGQSTLYLEHSWQIDRDAWNGSDGFLQAFSFHITVDPDDVVDELDEANNALAFTVGSWSPETGFGGPLLRFREIHVSSDVRDRIGPVKARAWRMTPVDARVIGDAGFYAISLATVNASEIAEALSSADQGDLFAATVPSAGVVFVDVGH